MEKEWTTAILDEKREHGDPLADEAAKAIFKLIEAEDSEEKQKKVAVFIMEFVSHDFVTKWDQDQHDIKIPQKVIDYFNNMTPFEFSDDEKKVLEKASKFFEVYGPKVILILYGRSLLKQYSHTKAIQVLRMTTLLRDHAHRRIIETMQFVVDVMNPSWHIINSQTGNLLLNTNHDGIRSIQKLRLVHAMIRYKILNKLTNTQEGDWNMDWGMPINQEDMIFATHTFSTEVIQGLQEMGAQLSDEEIENYYQAWCLIGRALGVDHDLIPNNYQQGIKLQDMIYKRHFTLPNIHGPHLADALVKWIVDVMPLFNKQTALTIIQESNGPKNMKLIETHLGLDLSHAHSNVAEHLRDIDLPGMENKILEVVPTIHLDHLFRYFMENLLKLERGGKRSTFRIGDGFKASWNLNRDSERPTIHILLKSIWIAIKAFFLDIIGYFKKDK